MTEENIYNSDDSMDINNELAALNAMTENDFSPDLIEELQKKLMGEAAVLNNEQIQKTKFDENDDTTLFEEPVIPAETEESAVAESVEPEQNEVTSSSEEQDNTEDIVAEKDVIESTEIKKTAGKSEPAKMSENLDDNFIKKYKAKLNKQKMSGKAENAEENASEPPIEELSKGKINETNLTKEQKEYTESLDFLDGNVKYSKYVIYIDPQNVDFIESLTVKERKNLINKILREQDDILITKQRFGKMQTIIRHAIIAILTISISIPIIYITLNASLEATIDNYRRSQTNFQTLYKSHGKISNRH